MTALIIKKPIDKALVIGPLYDKIEKLERVREYSTDHQLIVFNGNLCYPFDDLSKVEYRLDKMNELLQDSRVIYNMGNYDYQLLDKLRDNPQYQKIHDWLATRCNVVIATMKSGSNLVITCGGITPQMSKHDLLNNLEISFISKINQVSWHHQYGGGIGYIISNNPLTQERPRFYNFSAQIGNSYQDKSETYIIEVGNNGLKSIFCL